MGCSVSGAGGRYPSALVHSMTLAGATLGWGYMPGPPLEAAIALSIAFVAAEIIHGRQGNPGLTERYPWIVAFAFGLLHGFCFAGALTQVGIPQVGQRIAVATCDGELIATWPGTQKIFSNRP